MDQSLNMDSLLLKPLLELKTVTKTSELHALLSQKEYEVVSVFTETKPKIFVVIRHKYPFEIQDGPDPDDDPVKPKKSRPIKIEDPIDHGTMVEPSN